MAGSPKKVVVRLLDQTVLAGYLPAAGLLGEATEPVLDLLDLEGRLTPVRLAEVRWIAYVRDFNRDDSRDPERLIRRTFLARPRSEGLWVRITFAPGDVLEGLAPLDLGLLDGIAEDRGLFLMPPDARSNTQRLFVPRSAIAQMQVLAVVTTPSKSKPAAPAPEAQESLFQG